MSKIAGFLKGVWCSVFGDSMSEAEPELMSMAKGVNIHL